MLLVVLRLYLLRSSVVWIVVLERPNEEQINVRLPDLNCSFILTSVNISLGSPAYWHSAQLSSSIEKTRKADASKFCTGVDWYMFGVEG